MLRGIIVVALCLQLIWCEAQQQGKGAGANPQLATPGNRYAVTYGEVTGDRNNFPPPYPNNYYQYPDFSEFFPEYFRNLDNLLQETFESNLEHQKLAFLAAQKAYDLTSNQAGYISNLQSRYVYPGFQGGFPQYNGYYPMPGMQPYPPYGMNYNMPAYGGAYGANTAFASAALGPDYRHQVAAINPGNPNQPNVNDYQQFSDSSAPGKFMSVSSSSFSSSSTVDGKTIANRGAETVVNNNGKVTKYSVRS